MSNMGINKLEKHPTELHVPSINTNAWISKIVNAWGVYLCVPLSTFAKLIIYDFLSRHYIDNIDYLFGINWASITHMDRVPWSISFDKFLTLDGSKSKFNKGWCILNHEYNTFNLIYLMNGRLLFYINVELVKTSHRPFIFPHLFMFRTKDI